MDFGLTDEQESLRRAARDFLQTAWAPARTRRLATDATGRDADLYLRMTALGWLSIALPEEYGGSGGTFVDLAVIHEELGAALVSGEYLSSGGLAAPLVLASGTPGQRSTLLPQLARGELLATVAHAEGRSGLSPEQIQLAALRRNGRYTLTGRKTFVPDAHVADAMVVAARTADGADVSHGITLLWVRSGSPGLAITRRAVMDTTRRWFDVSFDAVEVGDEDVLGEVDAGWPWLHTCLLRGIALMCAQMVGGMRRILDMSVRYANDRTQFGRPIGSFQAVKHRCADMLVDAEMARSGMYYAAWAAAQSEDELPLAASVAKSFIGEAYRRVAESAVLLHGAIGFTWEHDLQLFLRRARVDEMYGGSPAEHREAVAQLIGQPSEPWRTDANSG